MLQSAESISEVCYIGNVYPVHIGILTEQRLSWPIYYDSHLCAEVQEVIIIIEPIVSVRQTAQINIRTFAPDDLEHVLVDVFIDDVISLRNRFEFFSSRTVSI